MNSIDPIQGFSRNVVNKYFKEYFPRSVHVAQQMRNFSIEQRMVYTTHAYLVSLYLDCPFGMGFYCPTESEVYGFKQAVLLGEIRWHAFPFNAQLELLDQSLFEFGIELSRDLAASFVDQSGQQILFPKVLSQRDVPGMTKAVIPLLRKNNVIGISIGVNGASMPAKVPKIFRWKFGEPGKFSEDEVLVTFHPKGYGGISKSDCAEIFLPELQISKVLCYAFRGDNAGPPESVSEVVQVFSSLRKQYPDATLITSKGGYEAFFEAVIRSDEALRSLTVIDKEIGDTWIYGVPSDPMKVAAFRAIQSARSAFPIKYQNDPEFYNFSRLFLKNFEHTWGGDVKTFLDASHAPEYYYWSNSDFDAHRMKTPMKDLELTWVEQRLWGFDYPLSAFSADNQHPFTVAAKDVLSSLFTASQLPDISSFFRLPCSQVRDTKFAVHVAGGNSYEFSFDQTGAINHLLYANNSWASKDNKLGQLIYQTFTEDDVAEFIKEYATCDVEHDCKWALLDFGKKGLSKAAPKRQDLLPVLKAVYVNPKSNSEFWVEVSFPDESTTLYGAPKSAWLGYQFDSDFISLNMIWKDKRPTRIPESLSFGFNPLHSEDEYLLLNKLGRDITIRYDGSSIINNGSHHLHAVQSGIKFVQPSNFASLEIITEDTPVVCLGQPTPFPTVAGTTESKTTLLPDYKSGLSFNLVNNIWGTNYIMWYPFLDDSSMLAHQGTDQAFRFKIRISQHVQEASIS